MDASSALTYVTTRFRAVTTKRAGVALALWGEAGVGKSHFTQELVKHISCRVISLHATTPLATLIQAFGRPQKMALWAEHLLERIHSGETVENKALLDALGVLFAALAPVVVHLEDSHEAEPERLVFIRELGAVVLRTRGVALLITSRQQPSEPFTAIHLEPLSRETSDRLFEAELKNALPRDALTWLYEKARGNPLYSLEYLRYLTRQGFLWSDGNQWHWRMPPKDIMPVTVEALIEQLLNQAKAKPSQREVLEARAFLPLEASDALWSKVAGVSDYDRQREVMELSRRGLFKEGDFAHPLFREVTLKLLTPERKQNLARRAIAVLEDTPELSVRFVDDAQLESEIALELLEKSARLFEPRQKLEASLCLEKAMYYASGERQGHLALRAARLACKAGDARSLVLARQAAELLGETDQTLRILVEAHALLGQRQQAQALLSRFSDQPEKDWLIQQFFTLGAFSDITRLTATLDPRTVKDSSIYFIAYVLMENGALTQAFELAEGRLRSPGVPLESRAELLDIHASVLHYQGYYQKADSLFSEVIELYKQSGKAWDGVANALRNRALNRMQLGLYREVLPDLLESLALYEQRGARILYAQTLVMLSDVYLELAQYDRVLDVLTESIAIFEHVPAQPFYIQALANLAIFYIEHPTRFSAILAPRYAELALSGSQELQNKMYSAIAHTAASRVHHFIGNFVQALEHADASLEDAAGFMELTLRAQTAKALALETLQQPEALSLLQSVWQTATEHGLALEANKIGLELDRLSDDVASARERLMWFEERGLIDGVNIARRYFYELTEVQAQPKPPANVVTFEVLGSFQVTSTVTTSIRGRKRQELIALLLEARLAGSGEVSRVTLLDKLYPNEDQRKASTSLKVLIHTLRNTLGESSIVTTNSGYALGECLSDVERFLQTGDTKLWRGPYLEGLESATSTVRDLLYLALFENAKVLLETNPQEVARVGELLIETEPYNRDYLNIYLTALRRCNHHSKLTRQYQEARARLLEVGELLPGAWQAFLSAEREA